MIAPVDSAAAGSWRQRHDRHNFLAVVASARPGGHNFLAVVRILGNPFVALAAWSAAGLAITYRVMTRRA
jgi:hypothetical protein